MPGNAVNRGMRDEMYLHRSLVPLPLVGLSRAEPPKLDSMSVNECYGACGV